MLAVEKTRDLRAGRLLLVAWLVATQDLGCAAHSEPSPAWDPLGGNGFDPGKGGKVADPGGMPPNPDYDKCGSFPHTSVSGVVFSPAGSKPDPLYNVIVFVPDGELEPFSDGVSCDKCGAIPAAKAKASTLSGPDGSFKLDGVPAGDDVPIVFQIGRWRRKVIVPHVPRCKDTELPGDTTRMPRNSKEGDIPRIAIVTGDADPSECLLRKIGIDDSEFTSSSGEGRIHLYKGDGSDAGPKTLTADALVNDPEMLRRYDLVLLPCEGLPNGRTPPGPKAPSATQNLIDYTAIGGRVFATHFSFVWTAYAQSPWPDTATWSPNAIGYDSTLTAKVDTSFPKGMAFSQWLQAVGASTAPGEIQLKDWRHNVDGPTKPSQRWIYSETPATVQHFTFNTPFGAPQEKVCGRVVYSNFHIVSGKKPTGMPPPSWTFPAKCSTDLRLDAQEKVLEFMLFDVASCVQNDKDIPRPPR